MGYLKISSTLSLNESEIDITAIRAQGAGGQHVNKVSTAIHLRFDIPRSSLPEEIKSRLLASHDYRLTTDGILIIKAQRYRSQEQNKWDAMHRLVEFIRLKTVVRRQRKKTKPSKASIQRRLESKIHRGKIKKLRQLPP